MKCNGDSRLHCFGSNYCNMVKEKTLVILGSNWKCKTPQNSHYETHVSSASYSYHDAMHRAANSPHRPPPQPLAVKGLNVWLVLLQKRLCAQQLYNYLLTYSMEQSPEKLTVKFSSSQEIFRIYGTRNFLTVTTSARQLSLS
jgi:hypothetical protein